MHTQWREVPKPETETGQDRQPGSEIKSFLKDISYNFTLSRQWTWTLQVVCLAAAKEIGKKPRENTQERKGTEGGAGGAGAGVGWETQAKQPLLYPRVSASCLKKRRQQEELRRRQKDKGEGRRRQQDAPKSLPLILLLCLLRRICMRLLNQLLLNIYFSTVHFSRGALGSAPKGEASRGC